MNLVIVSLLFGSSAAFSPTLLSGNQCASSTQLCARKPFISGNWKLNPQTKDEALKLADGIANSIDEGSPDADVALFVPYVFIESVMETVGDKIDIGAEVSCISYCRKCFFVSSTQRKRSRPNQTSKPLREMNLTTYFRVFHQKWLEHTPVLSRHRCSNPSAFNGLLPATQNVV